MIFIPAYQQGRTLYLIWKICFDRFCKYTVSVSGELSIPFPVSYTVSVSGELSIPFPVSIIVLHSFSRFFFRQPAAEYTSLEQRDYYEKDVREQDEYE